MKAFKKTVCAALCLAMVFALCACGSQTNDKAKKTNENDNSRIANPVHESSAEKFKAAGIVMPEIDGKTPVYTTIDGDETLYQADYGTFTIRAQKTDEQKDISGMNYEWTEDPTMTLELLQGNPLFKLDGKGAGIVYWYLNGSSWSVGMTEGASVDTLKSLYFKTAELNPGGDGFLSNCHLSRVNAQKSKNIFYEARMRAISSRKSCSEHR